MPLDLGSITLQVSDGTSTLSIAIDWRHQLKNFLAERLPAEDILFARWIKPDVPNPLSCGNAPEYLTPPYPPLPPISIGELQWPTGASRYARALYAVDWETMKAVAEYCWGYDGDDEPTDVPVTWGSASNYLTRLKINSEAEGMFQASMKILPPYRVCGTGSALWLLPLVDARFEGIDKIQDSTSTAPEDWTTFLEDVGATAAGSVVCDAVPSAYETVDPRLYKTIQSQRASQILDVGALSVGLRVVRDPNTGTMRVLNATNSGTRRLSRLTAKGNGELLSGGLRGIGSLPEVADLYCQRSGVVEKKSSNITGGNVGYVRLPIWTTWEYTTSNEAATVAFADQVTSDISAWSNSGGQYCFAGAFDYLPSGFDDFLSIQILETEPENYVFRSRIYELPSVFLPVVVLAGGLEQKCEGRRHWIGFLYHSYRGIVSGFWVVPTIALDGDLPDGPQWVVNIYRWNFGIIAATVRVEEDVLNERWLALQQEYVCPDNREIPEPPPPETPPPYPYPE